MSSPILTFEDQGKILRVVCDLNDGWRKREEGDGFVLEVTGLLSDLPGDRRMHVKVQIRPDRRTRLVQRNTREAFPKGFRAEGADELYTYDVRGKKLEVRVNLRRGLIANDGSIAMLVNSRRMGFHHQFWIRNAAMSYHVSLLVYFTDWIPPGGKVTWERDLLPFLPGGLPELGKRR
jgi:hypothetical protein